MEKLYEQFAPLIDATIKQAQEYALALGKTWSDAAAVALKKWFAGLFLPRTLMAGVSTEDAALAELAAEAADPASALPPWVIPLVLPVVQAILKRLLGA